MIIRGNGGEDVVGYSFGVHRSDHLWQGTLYGGQGRARAARPASLPLFGPDAILFNESALCKFGSQEALRDRPSTTTRRCPISSRTPSTSGTSAAL